jgi:hypothetical protein
MRARFFFGSGEVGSLIGGKSGSLIESELSEGIVACRESPTGDGILPELRIDQKICAHPGVRADRAAVGINSVPV